MAGGADPYKWGICREGGLVLLSRELAPRPVLSAPSIPKLLASLDPLEGGRVGSGS